MEQYFSNTLDPKQLIKTLSIYTEVDIKPHNTLLIFDEIQECPKALNSLKYSGEKGFPVGKVNFLPMYPLTFFEFLSAIGQEKTRLFLEEHEIHKPIPMPIHEKLLRLLKFYFFIGGDAKGCF